MKRGKRRFAPVSGGKLCLFPLAGPVYARLRDNVYGD